MPDGWFQFQFQFQFQFRFQFQFHRMSFGRTATASRPSSVATALAANFYKMGCQQIVGVDGAHIKSKLYNHVLFMERK